MDLWSVRSLTFQRTHSQKRRKVGDNLHPQEDDTEEDASKTWLAYLMKLETYLLALAVVGCKAIEPHLAPLRSWPATAWTMCRCPMTRCFVTITMLAAKISSIYRTADVRRLTVLQRLDVEERGQWSARAALLWIGDPCSAPRA